MAFLPLNCPSPVPSRLTDGFWPRLPHAGTDWAPAATKESSRDDVSDFHVDKIRKPLAFTLPELEIPRAGAHSSIKTVPFFGKQLENGCIAQVDFLGFSALLRRAHGAAADIVQDIYQNTELYARVGSRTNGDDGEPTIALFQYADTVNIVARDDGEVGIQPVIMATATLLASMHGRGLPARAGISMGEVWAISRRPDGGSDGDFVSGPALAAAHEVEAAQEWAGGVLDPSCSNLVDSEEVQHLLSEGWLVGADVPVKTKDGAKIHNLLAVNWARALHVPTDGWLAAVLDCENKPTINNEASWRKRQAAVTFYEQHGPGPLPAHREDNVAWLVSPSGRHLPLVPGVALTV